MRPNKKHSFFVSRGGERLESRSMLAAHPVAAAFNFGGGFAHNIAQAAHFSGFGNEAAARTGLTATLTDASGGASTGTFSFFTGAGRNGTTSNNLQVSVTGQAANTALTVAIGGVTVGVLQTDASGNGSLRLSETNFPTTVSAGAAVTVGTLSGTLATATLNGHGEGGGCHGSTSTTVSATLSDAANASASGTASSTTTTSKHSTTTSLTVSVTGAAASSSLPVLVNGTSVGTLTTDATGAGSVTLTTGLQSIAAGGTVSVGTLTGTFAASTSTGTGSTVTLSAFRRR